MAKITFEDKEKLIDNPDIDEKNKLTADNVNEIKRVINENGISSYDSLPVGSIIDFEGTEIPEGYEEIKEDNVLFENSEGTYSNFELAKDPNEFLFLEIYGITSDNTPCYAKIQKNDYSKRIVLSNFALDGNLYFKLAVLSIKDQNVSFKQNSEWYKSATTVNGGYVANTNAIKITKVIGRMD